jgi:hypothetical protein
MKAFSRFVAMLILASPFSLSAGTFFDFFVKNIRSSGDFRKVDSTYGTAIPTHAAEGSSSGAGVSIHDIDFAHQLSVEISFRAVGGTFKPGEYTVEWFFLAKEINSKSRWVFQNGSIRISGAGNVFDVISKILPERRVDESIYTFTSSSSGTEFGKTVETTVDVSGSSTKYKAGSKIEGWVVRIKEGGKVVRIEASLSELKNLALKSAGKFDAMAKSPAQ